MSASQTTPPDRLILASASPRRRDLLEQMGVPLEVQPSQVDEWEAGDADPVALVSHNADLKARALGRMRTDLPVLAADTTVAHADEVLNKPRDLDDARRMLRMLSGVPHEVHTAVSLFWERATIHLAFVVTSRVFFRQLTDADIDRYFELANPLDKAGAYGIQEAGEIIIERYEGSMTNIMGLPTERLTAVFSDLGWFGYPRS